MASLRGCTTPGCKGWMRWDRIACNDCNGTNGRASYHERMAMLAANIKAAAIEEMRMRRTLARIGITAARQPDDVRGK